jgi:hypothetical protein
MSNDNDLRDEYDAMWEVTRRPVPTPAERDEHTALRDAVAAERAAVVAWLRKWDSLCREWDGRSNAVSGTYRLAADAIERGEHRREETK